MFTINPLVGLTPHASGSDDLDVSPDEDSEAEATDPDVTVGELENPVRSQDSSSHQDCV